MIFHPKFILILCSFAVLLYKYIKNTQNAAYSTGRFFIIVVGVIVVGVYYFTVSIPPATAADLSGCGRIACCESTDLSHDKGPAACAISGFTRCLYSSSKRGQQRIPGAGISVPMLAELSEQRINYATSEALHRYMLVLLEEM
ncbi:hypothetical protein LU604_04390 [Erwinia tracheiphila]|uniref:hypothetical protein n=1 Tax=Erwinia tracheiphila TaxID=65700 RepID=UPI001F269154|nr:hypothetical protein [Erwinia tracheiphila]UIA84284.1 hypothetical protein LU604_04390 [Erwinia tracheiphila]UIA92865.1 hypothetical protein LU632_04345 [Erwinia tracheiphila]